MRGMTAKVNAHINPPKRNHRGRVRVDLLPREEHLAISERFEAALLKTADAREAAEMIGCEVRESGGELEVWY